MPDYLCISVTFLDERFHGQCDGGEPEWPPSPLRLFQSLVAANGEEIGTALRWLERQPPPIIIAPDFEIGAPFCLSVPNNALDIVGKAWSKDNYFGGGDANPATHRTMKTIRPIRMLEGGTVRYLWPLTDSEPVSDTTLETLTRAAGRMFALGWGIDIVVGHGASMASMPSGEYWTPSDAATHNTLRTPTSGTLDALRDRYESFLNRLTASSFTPINPLSRFDVVGYRRSTDPPTRPHTIFELRQDDGTFSQYPQRELIHLAGMVRHLAIDKMKAFPPSGLANVDEWLDRYVAGHARDYPGEHRQFSYIPLTSIGMAHTDPSVRRLMIAAPVGDDQWLEYLARRLSGLQLVPLRGDEFGFDKDGKPNPPPTLLRIQGDNVSRRYTRPANSWASVTPVILPGHTDRKASKTIKLIERSLKEVGIEQPCVFEWSPMSHFPKSLSAHKVDRKGKPIFFKPTYLRNLTAIHLTLTFEDSLAVPGPLVIGAGRHCGFGVMATFN